MTEKEKEKQGMPKVYFVGAGPGDPELITVKGRKLIEEADLVIYAGSLVNPELLDGLKADFWTAASSPWSELPILCCSPAVREKGLSGCTVATLRFTGQSWSRCSPWKRPVWKSKSFLASPRSSQPRLP